jgi:BirA family biotin operon repressor/biotin-[acetyl-CoA-carboxylase] ligase
LDKIKHFKLEQCKSTQDFLHNYRPLPERALCSTITQTNGRGRGEHRWENFPGSLSFSFTITPSPILTLTSLEIAVLISSFIKEQYQVELALKWPNDLLNSNGEKVGGILLQNSRLITVGVGLNWSASHPEYPSIFPPRELSTDEYHTIPLKITNYIYTHRLTAQEIINKWNKLCFHLNKNVTITDGKENYHGSFVGIGELGQALLNCPNEIQLFNGSLTIEE